MLLMKRLGLTLLVSAAVLSGCAPQYSLVQAEPVSVARGAMRVQPSAAWNRAPRSTADIAWVENWTENGPLLDSLLFIGGLPDGQAIVKQRRKADQKVPIFHATMTPQDLVSMVESAYRIRSGAKLFEATGVAPRHFLDHDGLQLDYSWVGADQVKHRGRAVIAVVSRKFYMIALDGAALHYFNATLPQFETLATGARLG